MLCSLFVLFHVNKVLMNSDEGSAGETCAENTETRQLCVLSTGAGMSSTSDSFSDFAVDKASSKTTNASASDDRVVHSKSEGRGVPEAYGDCLSCGSGTDEYANRNSNTEDSRVKHNKQSIVSGESTEVRASSLQHSENPSLVENPFSRSAGPTELLKIHNTSSQASNGKYVSHEESPRDVRDEQPPDMKDELLVGLTEHLASLSPGGVASDVCGDPLASLNHIEKNDDVEVEMHPVDETDDSDMVEQDVKVCDICGDAGREDLLAICCQCSDGAEHTYCMREMLAKVPEGEWLCEECKNVDQAGNERQEKIGRMDENEKNNSGQASGEYVNNSDIEGHRTKVYTKVSCKRHRDDADGEVSSTAKKPALESKVGSPKISNSSKTTALHRENSLKNKGRLQSFHHSSSDTVLINDTTESASSASDLRVHNFQGTFSKSNSFNSLNSKPKVKLVDQVVIQGQKSTREYGSFRLKEGNARSIGKSLSFKSTNSSQSDSKIKTISPRLSHIQDIKDTKQRSPFELQRSLRAEHSSINSMKGMSTSSPSRIDKRPLSRGESSPTTANHHEMKPVQIEGKLAALSRSSSLAARKTSDLSNSLGELKRPSIYGHSTPGVSSANGFNSFEQKSKQTSLKEEPSGSVVTERLPFIANEGLPDGMSQLRDLTNSGEQIRECRGSHCGLPSAKSSRDESDNLKAAIEAAVLRKPGVYRKRRASGQLDDSSVSSVYHMSISAGKKKLFSDAELPDRTTVSRSLMADLHTQETLSNVKQSSLVPVDCLLASGEQDVCTGPSSRDVLSNVSEALPLFLKSLAIPDHEHIWEGSFEIYRSGTIFDSWDGIQAHLSTCASSKVVEAVSKFKSKIVLNEVPRLSTWPLQFQEHGVREDNIALFFFSKDLESYDKIYKVSLDNMMKNDLALKGSVNGVELLIFPSNQLPDNSQRWNMLFFLWGVFRGKKENCLQHMPESLKKFSAPQAIPPPIMSLPENRCSQRPIAEDLPAIGDAAPALEVPASEKIQSLLPSRSVSGDFDMKVSFLDQLDHRLNSSSSAAVQIDDENNCQEKKVPYLEGGVISSSTPGKEQMMMELDTPLDRLQSSLSFSKSMAGTSKDCLGEGTILDKTYNQNQVKLKMNAGDPFMDGETPLENDWYARDLNMEPERLLFNHKECIYPGSYVVPRTLYASTNQVSMRNDGTHNETCRALEDMNHLPSGSYTLQNPHLEECVETLECNESAERHFFPLESQPVMGGSMLWNMHLLEQDQLSDRAPNLELALGAEKRPLTLGVQPLLGNKLDQKVIGGHTLKETRAKAEDDVAASLSLSLSFPFPEKELSTKPAPKTEQLLSEERKNTSMLPFGNLGDN